MHNPQWLKDMFITQKSLMPGNTNPFYIIAPPYTHLSKDAMVLHSLGHYLNMLGEDAYIIPYPLEFQSNPCWPFFCGFPAREWRNARLCTKILTRDIIELHFREGLTPICIIPEIFDNPFNAPFVARYILNYPDPRTPKYESPQHFTFSYSKRIADYVGSPHVLHIPTVDMDFFHNHSDMERTETCYYAEKRKSLLGQLADAPPPRCIELFGRDVMTAAEVRKIFWSSKYFYCYEDSPLAIEAVLCGCPVIFIPNEHLDNGVISANELGDNGFAWGTDRAEIERAKATAGLMESVLRDLYSSVPGAILNLAKTIKTEAGKVQYDSKIVLPYVCQNVFIEAAPTPSTPLPSALTPASPIESSISGMVKIPGWMSATKRRTKYILANWLLPPRIKQIAGRIWRRIRSEG